MADASLAVQLREGNGKGRARKLRAAGHIPAVLYGHGTDPISLCVEGSELEQLLATSHAGVNTLIELAGETAVAGKTVMIKELQREAVRGGLMHADLFLIDSTERLDVNIPVNTVGTAKGTIMGGLVDHVHREVEVSCLVSAIPDEIEADISELDIGDALHAGELILPKGVELKSDPSTPIVTVFAPKIVAEDEPTEGEEGAAAEADDAAEGKAED